MAQQFIDAHQHFWHYDPAKHIWMNADMGVIKKDFLPTDLAPFLKNCGLNGCVAVQANQAEIENDFSIGAWIASGAKPAKFGAMVCAEQKTLFF